MVRLRCGFGEGLGSLVRFLKKALGVSIRVAEPTPHYDVGYFMDKVMDCLGALGFGLCSG